MFIPDDIKEVLRGIVDPIKHNCPICLALPDEDCDGIRLSGPYHDARERAAFNKLREVIK